jgi:hypothetical protein
MAGVIPGKKLVGIAGIGMLSVRANPVARSFGIFGAEYPDVCIHINIFFPPSSGLSIHGAALIVDVTAKVVFAVPLSKHPPLPYAFSQFQSTLLPSSV